MHVPAIDVDELPGGVAGAVGQEKRDRVGDLVARRHALAERNARFDLLRAAAGSGCEESHVSYIGVQHSATITALTRMPYLASSTAHSRVSALRPPLAAA